MPTKVKKAAPAKKAPAKKAPAKKAPVKKAAVKKAAPKAPAGKAPRVDWPEAIKPLLKKYAGEPFPLDYKNRYQLVVMVVLAAQDRDANVNKLAPELFKAFPDMKALAKAKPDELRPYIRVRNFANKINWLLGIADAVKEDKRIPDTLEALTKLPGVGRKSANVILRESGKPAEGVIVDIHVVRVAPRLGIAMSEDPKKIEQEIMETLPRDEWDAGMAMSFLGRGICRPKPLCEQCLMRKVCTYYAELTR